MAIVSQQHVSPLASGFVGLLVLAILGVGVLNHLADK